MGDRQRDELGVEGWIVVGDVSSSNDKFGEMEAVGRCNQHHNTSNPTQDCCQSSSSPVTFAYSACEYQFCCNSADMQTTYITQDGEMS